MAKQRDINLAAIADAVGYNKSEDCEIRQGMPQSLSSSMLMKKIKKYIESNWDVDILRDRANLFKSFLDDSDDERNKNLDAFIVALDGNAKTAQLIIDNWDSEIREVFGEAEDYEFQGIHDFIQKRISKYTNLLSDQKIV